jgi:uncharacterized protein YodC (DUF2158 family)
MPDSGVPVNVGDTVSLNSGGHIMTVASIDEGSVTCDWSVRGDGKSKSFPVAELKKAEPPFSLEDVLLRADAGDEGQTIGIAGAEGLCAAANNGREKTPRRPVRSAQGVYR